jgi:hypothetical protein
MRDTFRTAIIAVAVTLAVLMATPVACIFVGCAQDSGQCP